MKQKFSFPQVLGFCVLSAAVAAAVILLLFWYKYGAVLQNESGMKLAAVAEILEENYVGEADMSAAGDAAAKALVDAAADEWSYYMTAEEYAAYQDRSNNRYAGIGVTILPVEDGLSVTAVTSDSPAARAGVLPGDTLLAVDGTSLVGMDTAEVRAIVRAAYGETLRFTLRRADGTETEVEMDCEYVYSPPVSREMLAGDMGYVRIENFEAGCAEGAREAVKALMEEGVKGIIFDVRSDPGGKLSELLDILDYLLPEGDLFVSVTAEGKETVHTSDAACVEIPMAVLIDENSYSAAEFFAAALSEYEAAVTVGTPSTGKGRSQITLTLSDGSAVHISSAKYLTPNRVDLAAQGGLTPDVEVRLSEVDAAAFAAANLAPADDAVVQRACNILSGKTAQ